MRDAVVPVGLEMVEEGADHRGVEVRQAQLGRRLAVRLARIQEQAERVAIRGDGMGTGPRWGTRRSVKKA